MKKYVYSFNEGSRSLANILGSKGAGLCEMTRIGIPVPFGFTITMEACRDYLDSGRVLSAEIKKQIDEKLAELEAVSGKKLGDKENPLLLAVRSGSIYHLPGMRGTVLNIGASAEPRKEIYDTITRLFDSWEGKDAIKYRKDKRLDYLIGNAVNVQLMAFDDNSKETLFVSLFSRNPITGENRVYGEYVSCKQGDDLNKQERKSLSLDMMEHEHPEAYRKGLKLAKLLETHFSEMQEIQFAAQGEEFYVLQTRKGRKTPDAAIKIALDMVSEGLLSKEEAILSLNLNKMRYTDNEEFGELVRWADEIRSLKVRCDAKSIDEIKKAKEFGCNGIGWIEIDNFDDLREVFRTMGDSHITIALGGSLKYAPKDADPTTLLKYMIRSGCRFAVKYPEMIQNEVREIMNSVLDVRESDNIEIVPEIAVPYVINVEEFVYIRSLVDAAAKEVFEARGSSFRYLVGCTIETPHSALCAGEIAEYADFFSFGGNDMTSLSFGIQVTDTTGIKEYMEKGLLKENPFEQLDLNGAGRLIKLAAKDGRSVQPGLKLGICGEQAAEPKTVKFAYDMGMTYVACHEGNLALAKLAAAQAQLLRRK